MNQTPKADFYATIKGPNYDNVWVAHDHFGEDLADQVKRRQVIDTSKHFYGMTDEELLFNKSLLKKVGLVSN